MANTELHDKAMATYAEIIANWNYKDKHNGGVVLNAREVAKMIAASVTHNDVLALLDVAGKDTSTNRDYWTAMFYGAPLIGNGKTFRDAPQYTIG